MDQRSLSIRGCVPAGLTRLYWGQLKMDGLLLPSFHVYSTALRSVLPSSPFIITPLLSLPLFCSPLLSSSLLSSLSLSSVLLSFLHHSSPLSSSPLLSSSLILSLFSCQPCVWLH